MPPVPTSLEQAQAELRDAQSAFSAANTEYEAAGRRRTTAINALNDAQKKFDEAVSTVRKGAPWDSHWHSQQNRGVPVTG